MRDKIVNTITGKVKGYERDGMMEYLGIPYAKPPVGELRLKRAVLNRWDGVYDAVEYGVEPIQMENGALSGGEDCLKLNVRTPLGGGNLPVMVYIHGGGFNSGAASMPLYDGKEFVKKEIVYVSIEYRLNVWGFYDFTVYPQGKEFDSNCGVSDFILAMQWIHENIAAFGGNPEKVTVAGESAGGTAVITLMAAPQAKGTFQQAIVSSAIVNGFFSHEMNKINMDLFLEGMGWTPEDLPKLKTIDPFEVLKANQYVAEYHQYRNPGIYLPSPVIDDLIPERPLEAIRNGSAAGIKMLISSNLHEGTMFVRDQGTNFPNSWDMIKEMFAKNGHSDAFEKIKTYYESGSHGEINGIDEAFINFATDYAFQVPAVKAALAQKNHGDVWMYRFEMITDLMKEIGLMAGHAMELTYEFAKKDFGMMEEEQKRDQKESVDKLTDEMHNAWVEFIKNGDPMHGEWPQYTGYKGPVRIYDENTRVTELDRTELMELWGDMRFYE
jgi:para-nitrobenzyl esterase